jgi:penicillin V acylase-like amidase (Ntn superfamily)
MKGIMFKVRIVLLSVLLLAPRLEACTRVLYTGTDQTVIMGRTLDWMEDMHSDLWLFPRWMKRNGASGPSSITWTSRYGSVIVSGYNAGTADGINEKGLVANVLYLAESDFGTPAGDKPLLSISLWAQYALDNFSTVDEAVTALQAEPFQILAPMLPNGRRAQLHLSLSDPTGDSAIFEYLDGKLVIHHGKQYQVMTNSPSYDQQLALNTYWESIGGTAFLPGTSRAADRFARGAFFLQAVPKTIAHQAVATVASIMRSLSVPLGISTPDQPNIASTLWRTIADQKNRIYYFDSATSPNTFWVNLAELDFQAGAPVKKLNVSEGNMFAGSASNKFLATKPFDFLSGK